MHKSNCSIKPNTNAAAYFRCWTEMTNSHASIARRRVRISGFPHSGWSAAEVSDAHSFEIDFRFDIIDDGSGNFLLAYSSIDGRYAADTWHETIAEAVECAYETFGIKQPEWSQQPKYNSSSRIAV